MRYAATQALSGCELNSLSFATSHPFSKVTTLHPAAFTIIYRESTKFIYIVEVFVCDNVRVWEYTDEYWLDVVKGGKGTTHTRSWAAASTRVLNTNSAITNPPAKRGDCGKPPQNSINTKKTAPVSGDSAIPGRGSGPLVVAFFGGGLSSSGSSKAEIMTGHPESSPPPSIKLEDHEADSYHSQTDDVLTLQTSNGSSHPSLLQHLQNFNCRNNSSNIDSDYTLPVPLPPSATPVRVTHIYHDPYEPARNSFKNCIDVKLEPLEHETTLDMDTHMTQQGKLSNFMLKSSNSVVTSDFIGLLPVKDEPTSEGEQQLTLSGDDTNDSSSGHMLELTTVLCKSSCQSKSWTQEDMDNALDALKNHNMSLTKASSMYGIPSTTLWQRAHRQGIDTPKKEGPTKSWNHSNLNNALHALRTGAISANKASKAYGIPSSTLYKIARREGIRLAAPFNAAPTTWCPGDLERALDSIRSGQNSVQRASTEFGIPTGTLYGRCKREGIELSRSNPTPWSENAMGEALEAVRVGQMSINQAAIHYNLPYSSLYGRFKRCKYDVEPPPTDGVLQHASVQPSLLQAGQDLHHTQSSSSMQLPHTGHEESPSAAPTPLHSMPFSTDGLPSHIYHEEVELPRHLYFYHQPPPDMLDSIPTS